MQHYYIVHVSHYNIYYVLQYNKPFLLHPTQFTCRQTIQSIDAIRTELVASISVKPMYTTQKH